VTLLWAIPTSPQTNVFVGSDRALTHLLNNYEPKRSPFRLRCKLLKSKMKVSLNYVLVELIEVVHDILHMIELSRISNTVGS
jgi:hypothetical protein